MQALAGAIMESELDMVVHEQQAVLSQLLTRVALVQGTERRLAFDALARALFAHLAVLRSVLLPNAGDREFSRRTAESGQLVAGIVARTIVEQQGVGPKHDIQALMTSVLSLLSQESALLKTAFDNLSLEAQRTLATEADAEFSRLAGPYELEELPAIWTTFNEPGTTDGARQ
jgi:hypothetical protein